ncbi:MULTISPECIES: Nif11-like leader peptide family RiPP precursor [Mycetohabitans]|uniref:Nif11-like leader peptide family RiPP n=1 Tax=Mycetohabitans rhizoxinica TaxID=412963 RepID=A0ABZ2PYE3_9BURK|nr:Nif11-like leader peptide family RiPP precursor [Mycetohabitans sp. B2]MCF7697352.1 Nif11-like leader peptide family RiPP precursor [Mycetohabitans sp. B2]
MSSIQQFRTKLESDPEFVKKIKNCANSSEIISVAQAEGISLSEADLAKALVNSNTDLTDEELESVSVGTPMAAALIK